MANIKTIKKKRVSKKTKDAWRKHVNIEDVEDFLEEKRADERLGGPIEKLPDQQLFQIETKPVDISKQDPRERRRLLYHQPPKCFQILQPSTKVPDPIAKRNRVRTKEERRDRIAKSIEESRRLKGIVKEKDRLAALNRQKHIAKKQALAYKKGDVKQDLWTVEDLNDTDNLKDEWNNSNTVRHNFQGLGKLQKGIPKSLIMKKSPLPNVELPHPGMSYNPSLKDHQNLLKEIVEKEEKIIKNAKHIERVTTKMFNKVTETKKQQSWLVEMTEGLNLSQVKEEPESDEDHEYKAINPPALNKKKDRKQRRKQKEQRQLEDERRRAKIEKKKISDIYKLRQLNKHILKKTTIEKQEQDKRRVKKQKKEFETKRLGHRKFEEPDIEFNMGEDISGNLRNMKFEGNLLLDRFKSLQKRNILQPTAIQNRKKSKVKKFEKATHKMGWESKGY